MSHKLCLTCAAVVESGARCGACGAVAVAPTRANLERALDARVGVAIDAWEAEGVLEEGEAARLRDAPSRASRARAERSEPAAEAPGVFERLSARQREIATRWEAAVSRLEADAAPPAEEPVTTARARSPGDARDAVEVGEGLFGGHGPGDAAGGAGIGALLGLDELGPPSSAPRPGSPRSEALSPSGLFAEYAWWFLGTLLVLAGSAMGVREAWRTLAGPPRQIVVAGALFGYHAMFLGLSALVAKRSARAGGVLAAIAVGLLPTVFVALAALVDGSRALGLGVSALVVALSVASLGHAAKRFACPAWVLPAAVVPSLVAELFVGSGAGAEARVAVPFVGVATVALAGRRLARDGAGVAPFASALYAGLSLALLSLAGAPGTEPARLEVGSLAAAGVWLYVVALSALVAHTLGAAPVRVRAPHLAPAGELIAFGGVALDSVVAGQAAVADAALTRPALAFAAVPALGACAFGLAVGRHGAAVHPAALLAVVA
ncbi:MAG TPA: hypothetical protein PLR99_31485, partial [Polyangiaceae bacterium]|nr:hypothetical protein [Polyangiaceae bacterium]